MTNTRLISALQKLRNLGNTLLIVEHDREVIDSADHVLDFGPGAGTFGGRITAEGSPKQLRRKSASLTGRYLSGKEAIEVPSNRRTVIDSGKRREPDRWLTVHGAYQHNLKEIDVALPMGRLVCVTGVSGSGKSSLITDILYKALAARIHRARLAPGGHQQITGVEHVDKVINVDQSPIGNSPSSNPATYTGAFDLIRELFARLPDSKIRGYTANRFSFNRPGGRCEACLGMGQRCIEMHFLPDVWVECENCKGSRYTAETLEIRYKGHTIADVLDMRIAEALELLAPIPKVRRMLKTLDDVGLGYLQLGQAAPTLSGGEAQRVKLAAELGRPATGKTLYILDEPTTGLHFDDLKKLLGVLHRLVDLGNTVVCVEHNLDVIKNADWIVDLGPEAGDTGGNLVAACTPEDLLNVAESHTARALRPIIEAGPVRKRKVFSAEEQAEAEAEMHRPMRVGESEVGAKMPWESDGRRWHVEMHLDHEGKPAKWDAAVLEWIVETTEKLGGMKTADWNSPSTVEVRAPGSRSSEWFLHARTRNAEQLDLSIRVPVGSFNGPALVKRLGIVPLNDRDDLPIYSGSERVQLRNINPQWADVRVQVRDFKDVEKRAFKKFLQDAATAYLGALASARAEPEKAEPWKVNPRQWHMSQRGIHHKHKVIKWKPALLPEFIGLLTKHLPGLEPDWSRKVVVVLMKDSQSVCSLCTTQPQGVRVHVQVPKNSVTPTQIDRLGIEPKTRAQEDYDEVIFWLRTIKNVDFDQLKGVMRQAAARLAALKETTA